MKWGGNLQIKSIEKRPSPHGEGGLKYYQINVAGNIIVGPSPHGEGGLKWEDGQDNIKFKGSLPTRGGWIEMRSG